VRTFQDRVAVITGAASGIGRGSALALARRGVHVVVADLNAERGAKAVREIEGLGVRAIFQRCDVTSDAEVASLRQAALEAFGRVNILMNNAGVLPLGGIEDTPTSEWERTLQVNLISIVRGIRTFLPDLLAADEAHIVNTASLAGLFAYDPALIAYAASKAAAVSLSEHLALALRPQGVGVTCLCPAPVKTNIGEQARVYGAPGAPGEYARVNLQGRLPEEVGEMVADAIRDDRFLLHTDEAAAADVARRGRDPDAFLRDMSAFLTRAG